MNQVIIMGRLTADPEIRQNDEKQLVIGKYTLAVDRIGKDKGTDFIRCVSFGKGAEFADKYLKKGTKVLVSGHIQTGSYTDKDGRKVFTTDVIVESQEFAEAKRASGEASAPDQSADGFMDMPDGGNDDMLPFN